MTKTEKPECFVIMPISDHKDYESGHFRRVYEDIIKPACDKADYKAIRADDIEETDVIHISILKKLLEAPMAICDLSTKNPNVLFELGLRQAFDKPVVLIQEKGTDRIFDVSILRAYDYCKELTYKDVLDDQESISRMLKGTEKAFVTGEGFNSVIKLMSLANGAKIKSVDDPNEQFKMQLFQLSSQIEAISSDLKNFKNNNIYIDLTDSEKDRLRKKKIHDTIENEILTFDYEEFLHFYNRYDYPEMLRVYKKMHERPVRTFKDKEILNDVGNRMKEYQKNNPNKD